MAPENDRGRAFEALFDAHYWAVRAYVRRRAPEAAVEDAVSETFMVAWRRLDDIAPADDALPWLLGVARRVLANQVRADRRRGALVARLADRSTAGSDWQPPAGMDERLRAAVAALAPAQREALLLTAWDGLEPARAAQVAGCTPAAFRVRVHRARRRVARALQDTPSHPSSPPIAEEAS